VQEDKKTEKRRTLAVFRKGDLISLKLGRARGIDMREREDARREGPTTLWVQSRCSLPERSAVKKWVRLKGLKRKREKKLKSRQGTRMGARSNH